MANRHISLFIAVGFYAFNHRGKDDSYANVPLEDRRANEIRGEWFIQPQQRELSLNMATLHTVITINFLDSVYCTIHISSAAGEVALSRTYKIEDKQLMLEEPTTGRVVKYMLDEITDDAHRFSLSSDGLLTFHVVSIDNRIRELMNSDNSLKKNELLYPNLSPGERANGTSEVFEINGRLETINNPNKAKIDSISVYKLF